MKYIANLSLEKRRDGVMYQSTMVLQNDAEFLMMPTSVEKNVRKQIEEFEELFYKKMGFPKSNKIWTKH